MTKHRAAGYSLVEIAIALAVLGILLSAALVPLQNRFEQEDRREVEQILDTAVQSVTGYAVSNRTLRRTVEDADGVRFALPAGRPYLPCPDINGDGEENRISVTVAISTVIALTSSVMTDEGVCEETKGLLPWRTLGMRMQSDPWGRRIGYRVDPAFSSEIMGFDETFRADIFDPRVSLTANAGGEMFYQTRASRDISGALVCSEIVSGVAAADDGCPNLSPNMPNLIAGIVATVSLTIGARIVPAYADITGNIAPQGILDGAAFVVYSHGRNGRGAINAESNICISFAGAQNFVAAGVESIGERANAFYRTGHPFLTAAVFTAGAGEAADAPSGCDDFNAVNLELAENLFFSAPRNKITDSDDILVWTSPNALVGSMLQAGALPIPKLGFLPDER